MEEGRGEERGETLYFHNCRNWNVRSSITHTCTHRPQLLLLITNRVWGWDGRGQILHACMTI